MGWAGEERFIDPGRKGDTSGMIDSASAEGVTPRKHFDQRENRYAPEDLVCFVWGETHVMAWVEL